MASSSGIVVLVAFGLLALSMSSDAGCESGDDDRVDVDVVEDDVDVVEDDFDVDRCDGVVVVQSASGSTSLPSGDTRVESSASVECNMREGDVDEEAVRALQDALVRCNGQNIAVDGNFGQQTQQAIARVQEQNGLAADGFYGPETRDAMQWPATSASGTTTCVSNVSSSIASDEGS
ncbi:MAG TPA: peptidoglycan-binding domain-containing protein [Acidimicrobiales bacterium]|nr:peptidoglycan-binding domain-containing protein [Acidimicrobiales bacterium]